jgi:ParB/RepB/Spo0J family partition protein
MSGKTKTETSEIMTINVADIVVDTAFNARKTAEPRSGQATLSPDDTARELAKSIKKDGQLTPVMVERLAKPGKDGKKFYLIFGFQRMRAISGPEADGFLGRDSIMARVVEPMAEIDRMYLNAVENVARADLSTYDLALRCFEMNTKFNEKGTKIAARFGKNVGYINNLIRIRSKCCRAILDRWTKESSPGWKEGRVCTTDWMVKVSALSEADQEKALAVATGQEPTGATPEGEAGGDGASNETSVKRATMKHLKAAKEACITKIAEAKADGNKARRVRFEGVLEALLFAMGEKPHLLGVYDTRPNGQPSATAETAEEVADQN